MIPTWSKTLFDKAHEAADNRKYRVALLGRHNPSDDTVSFEVAGRLDMLWVTIPNKGVVPARNEAGVPQVEDLQVKVYLDHGTWTIAGRSTRGELSVPTPTPPSGVLAHTLASHTDVSDVAPASGDVLQFSDFDGLWSGVPVNALGLTLDDLNGVTVPTPASGDLLQYTAGDWVNAATSPINHAATIHAATGKTTPVDADELGLIDSAAANVLKKVTWVNIKATFKAYYDSVATTLTNKTLDSTNISTLTSKTTPIDADSVVIVDSAATNFFKRVTGTNWKAYMKTYFDTLYNLYVHPNHTGDVTSAGDGATTIANDAVTNAKAANMAADTVKGRANGAGTGDPTDLSATQVRTIINVANGADVTGTAITALAAKTTPVDADSVVITDSAASDVPKRVTGTNWKAYMKTYLDTLYVLLAGKAGGQTVSGGTAANEDLTLRGTAHATKTTSYVLLQDTGGFVHIGGAGPSHELVVGDDLGAFGMTLSTDRAILVGSSAGRAGFAIGQDATHGIIALWNYNATPGSATGSINTYGYSNPLLIDASVIALQSASGGGVAIGLAVATAPLDVLQATLGGVIFRLASTATNDDPTEDVVQNKVLTTNATVTTIHTFTIPASTTYMIRGVVVARRTGGASGTAEDGAAYTFETAYKNAAGVATEIPFGGASNVVSLNESQAAWDVTLSPTGATVRVRVTGAANNSISWVMTARIYPVSS